jgi:hypothetical protein
MPLAPMLVSFLAAPVMSAVLYQLIANLGMFGTGFLATSALVTNINQTGWRPRLRC